MGRFKLFFLVFSSSAGHNLISLGNSGCLDESNSFTSSRELYRRGTYCTFLPCSATGNIY
uniref:Uncharacterized protein n=1 Tax=Anguilla anguilla TaxID=7936 RepID=A0A0E9RT89_ANGAN